MTTARTNKPTTVPGIPKPPAEVSPTLRKYLESLSEAVEIRLGRRGDPRDRAITLRELIDSGLAVELGANPFQVGPAPPPPPPPPPLSATPTAPANFTATGGYSLVTCFWDYPNYGPHSHTEIWRHDENILGDAQLVGISSGISFVDPVGEGASYYYWARHVSLYDIQGPFNAINGTLAETALDVVELLNVLTGAITESQLYQALQTRINLIDGASSLAGSVNARILTETNARNAAIEAEANARTAAILAEATARGTAITNEATIREDADESLSQQITTLTSVTLPGTYATIAALQSETTARTDAISAEASARDTLAAQLRGTYTGTDLGALTSGLLFSERQARVTDDSALASRSDALEATVNNSTTGLVATRATLINDYYTKTATDSAIAASSNTLTSNFNNTLGNYVTSATLTNNYYTASQTNSAISAATTNLVSTTTLNNTLSSYVTTATLTNNYYTETDTDQAISNATSTVTANFNNTLTGYATTAAVQQNYFAKADGQALQGQYTVKIDLDGYVTGFGLASTAVNGTPTSEFIVRVDRFSIASPGYTTIVPFLVTNATTINGVSVPAGVYMNDAYIRNGTITNAKIGNAAIDDAKIASLSADKITAGTIDTARLAIDNVTLDSYYDSSIQRNRLRIRDLGVDTAKINNAAITTAKIGDLAVSTLKIAGNAVTQPQTYTASDRYIDTVITVSGAGFVFVGYPNGDHIYEPEFGGYIFVGQGSGDYAYSAGGSVSGGEVAIETALLTIGIDNTAAVQIVFYATMDAGSAVDAGQQLIMQLNKNDGNGYQNIAQTTVGSRTSGGNTYTAIPMAMTFTAKDLQYAQVKVITGTRRVDLPTGTASNPSWLRNITVSMLGAKR